jgi:hypothetical protein
MYARGSPLTANDVIMVEVVAKLVPVVVVDMVLALGGFSKNNALVYPSDAPKLALGVA